MDINPSRAQCPLESLKLARIICLTMSAAPRTRAKRTTKAATAAAAAAPETTVSEQEVPAAPATKKSTKKKFPVVAVVTPDGIEGTLLPPRRPPLIVHLPLQSRDVPLNDMPILYDPAPPAEAQPYDYRDPFTDTFGSLTLCQQGDAEGEANKKEEEGT
jgi:hypothetical protein